MAHPVSGFSKMSKSEKIDWLTSTYFSNPEEAQQLIENYWNSDEQLQRLHDEFIENTVSNFYLPLGVAPNFSINGKLMTIPMAIEESSVVAAASKAAKFWLERGGFKATVISTEKIGQVHFKYEGETKQLQAFFEKIKPQFRKDAASLTKSMEARGGGISDIQLIDKTAQLENYFQLHATFETLDAMGANFINSCLEQFASTLKREAEKQLEEPLEVVMSILSNYVPNCLVRAEVSCPVKDLVKNDEQASFAYAEKFVQAVTIAEIEPFRAVTHNKGIMNGIDAVVIASGNDFRAVEAGVHAFASKNGRYSSLSHASIDDGMFRFWLELPLALGTVGGLTKLHPLVTFCLGLLGNPSAKELMKIVAVAGLAQNFAALNSLTTTGIQEGHMKMHLGNILNSFQATKSEKEQLLHLFKTRPVSHSAVEAELKKLRQ